MPGGGNTKGTGAKKQPAGGAGGTKDNHHPENDRAVNCQEMPSSVAMNS